MGQIYQLLVFLTGIVAMGVGAILFGLNSIHGAGSAEQLERLLIAAIGREPQGPLLNRNGGVRPLDEPIVEREWMINRALRRRDPMALSVTPR